MDPAVTGEAPGPGGPSLAAPLYPVGSGLCSEIEAKGGRHFWGNLDGGHDVQAGVLGRGTACKTRAHV